MTGALLRTGSLKSFQPLGAVGNPVYLAAAQLRAAIGRRLGPGFADTLAIPHRNEDGDTIDWYAPQSGPVVPWSAATPEERARAKERLLSVRDRIDGLGREMQGEANGERQVFGRLLEHVTVFPNDGHVYLVGGQPVVTFWGFQVQDARAGSDPLLNLEVASTKPPVQETPARRFSWWWLLPLLLLLTLLLVWLLRGCDRPSPPPVPVEKQETAPPEAKKPTPEEETPPGEEPSADEPGPPDEPPPPEVLVREHKTDVVTRDQIISDVETVRDRDLEVDAVTGAAVEAALSAEVEESVQDVTGQPGDEEIVTDVEGDVLSGETESTETATEELPEATADEAPAVDEPMAETAPGEMPQKSEPEDALEEPLQEPEDAGAPDVTQDLEGAEAETPPQESPTTEAPTEAPQDPATPRPTEDETGVGAQKDAAPDASQPSPDGKTKPPGPETSKSASPLKIPPGAVSAGSTRFLNGGWRTSSSLQDPRTALPVDMEYRLKDGAGRLDLRRSDGSVCSGDVKAALEDGRLVIQNARDIVCPDGTNFGRPRLECVPGKDGRADCSGRYETGEDFSVDIKKAE